MIPVHDLLIFAAASLLLVLTPGPNMIYLISRSICQGRKAGVTSLIGVVAGFFVHLFAAAAGLTAVFLAVPMAYEVLKWAGALYLLWMAWQAVKPGARSPFEAQQLPPDSSRKLMLMGFFTSALNPKIAVFYLSVFPQFIDPAQPYPLQFATLVLTYSTLVIVIHCGYALFARRAKGWLQSERGGRLLGKISAGSFVYFGASLATAQR